MNALVSHPSPEQLHRIFFDPPEPPVLPAKRLLRVIPKNVGRKYRRRKSKLESQGQADRRVRRSYRAAMVSFYQMFNPTEAQREMCVKFDKWCNEVNASRPSSLYDFVMGRKTK